MTEGWFSFQRDGGSERPDSFQSPDLDYLFLERADIKISAAWCISCRDRRLIYFWGDRSEFNDKTEVTGRLGYCLRKFRHFFETLRASSGVLLADTIFKAAAADPIKYVSSTSIDTHFSVEIYAGKSFVYFYQLKKPGASKGLDDLSLRTYLLDRSERGFEFARQAETFFERIPKSVLNIDQSPDDLIRQYFGPICYDPSYEHSAMFAWPWQKCLERHDGVVRPIEIPTISLIMDLRNSSSAMLLTPDAPKFSVFVDKVVEGAREIITENGGYFDKDTGDGVVGHFEAPVNWEEDATALNHALRAARGISHVTTRLCGEYQEHLSLRLQGLGCAVGLFAGKAVWLYSWRGVRAIGGSIVNAARICANAKPGEVGYCNKISSLIRSSGVKTEVFPLSGVSRPISLSEVREAAIPEATFVQVN
ncbi:MAG: hypothetical protein WDN08_07395 [Rhizomicrobium sp.]